MNFFMSAEIEEGADEGERSVRKKIEPLMIELLSEVELESGLKEWSFIPIIMSDKFIAGFPEFVKLRRKDKSLDCRVHIEYERFKSAHEQEQVMMALDAMERSIKMMDRQKITENDQVTLKDILSTVRKKLLITN